MKTVFSAVGLTLALGVLSLTGCRSANTCAPGYEHCPCTVEGSCNAGLVCEPSTNAATTDTCIDPNAPSTGGQGSGTGGSGSGGDDTGTGGDGTGTGGAIGTGGVIGAGGVVGGTGGVTAGCTEGDAQGSCSTGNAMDCYLGSWVAAESCAACSVVSPSTACDRVTAFVLDSYLDAYTDVPGGVTSESYTVGGASATYSFGYDTEIGYVQFKFPYAISPSSVNLTASATSGTIIASLENGENGCEYTFSGTSLVWDTICWGTFSPMDGGYASSPATVLNVRVTPSASATVTLSVSGLTLGGI